MDRGIAVDAKKCTGCNSCEIVCHFNKAKVFDPKRSRVKVVHLVYLGFSNPVMCILCQKPKCVAACAPGALSQNAEGIIELDGAKCDGCRQCVDACIVGAINFDEADRSPLICDLCGGKPACVEWCTPGALTYDGPEELAISAPGSGQSAAVAKRVDVPTRDDVKISKQMKYTLTKAKPVLKSWGLPGHVTQWYEKFVTPASTGKHR